MTLQTSGNISLADIIAEFGGPENSSITDYYRGGAYVPSSIVTTGPFSDHFYELDNPVFYVRRYQSSGNYEWRWAGEIISGSSDLNVIVGGYEYWREFSAVDSFGGSDYYRIYRRTYSSESVNEGVPSSGNIKLTDFYGARSS